MGNACEGKKSLNCDLAIYRSKNWGPVGPDFFVPHIKFGPAGVELFQSPLRIAFSDYLQVVGFPGIKVNMTFSKNGTDSAYYFIVREFGRYTDISYLV